jgi:hypothetical protein
MRWDQPIGIHQMLPKRPSIVANQGSTTLHPNRLNDGPGREAPPGRKIQVNREMCFRWRGVASRPCRRCEANQTHSPFGKDNQARMRILPCGIETISPRRQMNETPPKKEIRKLIYYRKYSDSQSILHRFYLSGDVPQITRQNTMKANLLLTPKAIRRSDTSQ